ncbi:MAG: hypothetical protein HY696_10960 [Deltaproteobacteria bacterium]|nr:hypothetical protein [Deltaproteobacteria bacterium]
MPTWSEWTEHVGLLETLFVCVVTLIIVWVHEGHRVRNRLWKPTPPPEAR